MPTLIAIESWLTQEQASLKYEETADWDRDSILAQVAVDATLRLKVAGHSWHVGGGQWLSVCGYCDAYSLTWGAIPAYANLGPHMVAEHDAKVAGINVGILP